MPPEARLNLVIHYLRHNEVSEAFNLIKDMEPTTPQEYILKVGLVEEGMMAGWGRRGCGMMAGWGKGGGGSLGVGSM